MFIRPFHCRKSAHRAVNRRTSVIGLAIHHARCAMIEQLEFRECLSAFYGYDIIAQTGSGLTSILPAASINDSGDVAFVASSSAGQSVYFVDSPSVGPPSPPAIISFASPTSTRTYGQEIQLNNSGQVAAIDIVTVGSQRLARSWDSNSPGSNFVISRSSSPLLDPSHFDSLGGFTSMTNDGQLAFTGFESDDPLPPSPSSWEIHLADGFVDTRDVINTELSEVATVPAAPAFFRFMAADGDRVVIGSRDSASGPKRIIWYDITGIDTSETIADTTGVMWSDLGVRPGISDDGSIVVFYGELTATGATALSTVPGPGIFASILEGSGSRRLIRVAGGNGQFGAGVLDQPPDLGYAPPSVDRNSDGNINYKDAVPIYLQTFDVDSRISVATLQAGGSASTIDAQDSFVVTFLGTPSQASRAYPSNGVPLLFTDQRGVWSMRVDVDAPLTGSGNPFYNRTSAIPVVQINDIVGGQSVTTLAVHDAVALASPLNNSGAPLPVNRGDHAVAFHAGYLGGSMIVRANHVDADQDGLFDHWETTGLDMDRDGVVDFSLTSFGTNRLRRDLFLEIDWLSPDTPTSNPMNHRDFSPQAKALDDVVSTFATAPVTNPDNSMGITVHIDAGAALSRPAGVPRWGVGTATLQGGDLISEATTGNHIHAIYFDAGTPLTFPGTDAFGRPYVGRSMDSIKSSFFGTVDKRARELVFHYVVFGDRHTSPSTGSSGRAEIGFFPGSDHSIAGNDVVVTLQGRRDPGGILQVPPSGATTVARPVGFYQSQTLIHELGHNLGLRHGGVDNQTSSPWATSPTFNAANLAAKASYRSLMNYAYQNNADPSGNLVRTYSSGSPFNDWANIKLNFKDSFFFVGNTFGLVRQLGDSTAEDQDVESSLQEFEAIHGPLDFQPPTVTINPSTPTQVPVGGNIPVTINASDLFGIAAVLVQFDVNGDGSINPATEESLATLAGAGTYTTTFSGISGPVGSRTLSVVAIDGSDFVSTTTSVIMVGGSTSFQASSFTPTSTGVVIDFNRDLDPAALNLYDLQGAVYGPADVTLVGATSGAVRGSVVIDPNLRRLTFVSTVGNLPPDSYTLTLRSAADGFVDSTATLLDGDANGTAGGNYVQTFSVGTPPANMVTLSVANFARGPRQPVNVPATATSGLPISFSNGGGISVANFQIRYNPALLTITGGTVATGLTGATVNVNTSTPGVAVIQFSSPTPLAAGTTRFIDLQATVPESAPYRSKHVLDIGNIVLNPGPNAIPSVDDDAVHVAAYFGDATGNGTYGASDASRVSRLGVGFDTGFQQYKLLDPFIIGDITGNNSISATDASRVLQVSVAFPVAEIPPLPIPAASLVFGGPDPKLSIPTDLVATAGSDLIVPVQIDSILDLTGTGFDSADLVLYYDPAVLDVTSVSLGGLVASRGDWIIASQIDASAGRIFVSLAGNTPLEGFFIGELVQLQATVKATASTGPTAINIAANAPGTAQFTQLNDGFLTLIPAPSNAADDPGVDGLLTIVAAPNSTLVGQASAQVVDDRLLVVGTGGDDRIIVAALANDLVRVRVGNRLLGDFLRPSGLAIDGLAGHDLIYVDPALPATVIAANADANDPVEDLIFASVNSLLAGDSLPGMVDSGLATGPLTNVYPRANRDLALLQMLADWSDQQAVDYTDGPLPRISRVRRR